MTYKEWLITRYICTRTMRGELARDINADKTFPVVNDRHTLLNYLSRRWHYSDTVRGMFKRSWKDYKNSGEQI